MKQLSFFYTTISQLPKKSVELRDYQIDILNALFATGIKHTLVELSTGGGKTVIMQEYINTMLSRNAKVVVLAHTNLLVSQLKNRIGDCSNLHISTWQSHIKKDLPFNPQVIIIDEAHRAGGDSYLNLFKKYKGAKRIGFSATPQRTDRKPLSVDLTFWNNLPLSKELETHSIEPSDGIVEFDKTIVPFEITVCGSRMGASLQELQNAGFLSKTKYHTTSLINRRQLEVNSFGEFTESSIQKVITPEVIEKALRDELVLNCKKGIVFVTLLTEIATALLICEKLNIKAKSVSSAQTAGENQYTIDMFETDDTQLLIACMVLNEGIDIPSVDLAVILRPTKSQIVHNQQIGRTLRVAEGKDFVNIFDVVGNIAELGTVEEQKDWAVYLKPKTQTKSGEKKLKKVIIPELEGDFDKIEKVDEIESVASVIARHDKCPSKYYTGEPAPVIVIGFKDGSVILNKGGRRRVHNFGIFDKKECIARKVMKGLARPVLASETDDIERCNRAIASCFIEKIFCVTTGIKIEPNKYIYPYIGGSFSGAYGGYDIKRLENGKVSIYIDYSLDLERKDDNTIVIHKEIKDKQIILDPLERLENQKYSASRRYTNKPKQKTVEYFICYNSLVRVPNINIIL